MRRRYGAALASVALVAACGSAGGDPVEANAATASPAETEAAEAETDAPFASGTFEVVDYSDQASWLCHPEKANDACDVDLTYTVVNADGTTSVEAVEIAENPPIDCFYIYPTVSMDETPNSDMTANDEERRVVEGQLAAFAQECRLFAPLYRQITVPELRRGLGGQGFTASIPMRWSDVTRAWNEYVDKYNDGRGVVLLGHSQGSSLIQELVKREIVGSEMEDRIVSLMPTGMTTHLDADTGAFGPYAPCEAMDQTGCIIAYSSYRSTLTPTEGALFGGKSRTGKPALCVNPAELSGDNGALDARLSARGWYGGEQSEFVNGEGVDTPFAAVPGLLTAECVDNGEYSYLEITVNGDPSDPRADDIVGDVTGPDGVYAGWGLHLIDMHAAMGNLVKIVGAQSDAWLAAHPADE